MKSMIARTLSVISGMVLASMLAACGGASIGAGGSTGGGTIPSSGSNVQAISVNLGPNSNLGPEYYYQNGVFTSVEVCTPGTTICQTIDNILVDTGSYGLRLLGSAVNISLPTQTNAGANPIGECTVFADGYVWGPVAAADVLIADETASSVPIQLISADDNSFPPAPSSCSEGAGQNENTLATLDANGILGIGVLEQDCGAECSTEVNNDFYYQCSSSTQCIPTTEPLSAQVTNPVTLFASDNNGVEIQLPEIASGGAATATGAIIFGIGTRSNNALGSATALKPIDDAGDISVMYNGASSDGFIDSGSNALYFSANFPTCSQAEYSDFYCPTSTQNESVQVSGPSNQPSVTVMFSVANAATLFGSGNAALDDLAGTSVEGDYFDFGLPFFYGRNVFFAIENKSTPAGVGPYYAF